ncbi:NAD-glutamate dehydrogenase [Motiliproteus coralliicola]|uniref:NAD-glutamate dehydrogenase n=1 Tax=Motiliproteus coralliicola TaxID=2283196 RepID=A0A369W9M2_9GAMM|nr:NAD-glutamate dehydrogenase [Motiliproteus coralliicola]RDE18021.1 NAD-glutamate dehydrogenase [Motiliproteus coralliicola]
MNRSVKAKHPEIVNVQELLAKRLPKTRVKDAQQLASQYYSCSVSREIARLATEDLYGAILCLWDLLQQRRSGQALVRLYNPTPEDHRWHSTHSILEVLSDDMPFLVASISLALDNAGITIHQITHPVIQVERDKQGKLKKLLELNQQSDKSQPEALMRIEIDHQPDEDSRRKVIETVEQVIQQVRQAVEDWPQMCDTLRQAIEWSRSEARHSDGDEADESLAFLNWLLDDHFVFLGYRYYELDQGKQTQTLRYQQDSGLGLFRVVPEDQQEVQLDGYLGQLALKPDLLVLTKSTSRSTVQRPAYLDRIGVKKIDADGKVLGEWRFYGLYSSTAYSVPLEQVPLLRRKVSKLFERAHLTPNSHSGKNLRHLVTTFPRDEMLQAEYDQLEQILLGMLECEERRQLRLFLRPDTYDRYITAQVLVPRDHYDTELRQKMRLILLEAFDGHASEFTVRLSDHALAQIQFTVHCHNAHEKAVDIEALEARMNEAMASWQDQLHAALSEKAGEAEANRLLRLFANAMPVAYRDDFSPRRTVTDLQRLAELQPGELSTYLYRPLEEFDSLHFKVLGAGDSLALSDVLPILEHMGVRVLNARPYSINCSNEDEFWILDFRLSVAGSFDPEDSHLKQQFQETFTRSYYNQIEDDGFNELVIAAGLSWRQVMVLRAICKYLLQLAIPFSQKYMEETLSHNPHVARNLVKLFETRFDPDMRHDRDDRSKMLIESIDEALEAVENLDQDRILRHYLSVIQAMLRTNFYQVEADGLTPKGYASFKLDTDSIPAAPQPRPKFETFIYAPWVEGVHLRGGKVARGGLRWSDRREDFRTEVLGLVKAQMVKNAVIVPVGAKGGFVPKQLPTHSREAMMEEGIRCYETFIRALLDLADNRQDGKIIPPENVVRYDDDDPYLVVAADKGTATFSDIANRISVEYGFWLGDAFASGGANGYDHKKMGITARGAWESVKRLFLERGIDCQTQPFTAAGIGDMGGDVFGNGMLLSKQTKLVAAFNHLHIFIDPDPDPATSWEERKRLFDLPRSSWEDYNSELISHGGGVFSRASKSITLSDEIRKLLDVSAKRLAPNELIQAILKAPVDLLWNGGIGTYVKSEGETNDAVGDRANDALRINGNELRTKIVGEGGNLGMTQRGRVEYARQGGLLNTDAIDNAGGVHSSDYEVNLKILLDQEVAAQDLTAKQRNRLLASMTDEVASLVLQQNYHQSQILSLVRRRCSDLIDDHRRLIHMLESEGRLRRRLEFLPNDEQLEELSRSGAGLTRPEIAVLLAYSKLRLFDQLIEGQIGDDEDLAKELPSYFPVPIQQQYPEQLDQHPLRSELIATHITNLIGNRFGSTIIHYLEEETRCDPLDAVRALLAARDILDIPTLWQLLEEAEVRLDNDLFSDLMLELQQVLKRSALWLLRNNGAPLSIARMRGLYRDGVKQVLEALPELLSTQQQANPRDALVDEAGLPDSLKQLERLYYPLDIVMLAHQSGQGELPATEAFILLEKQLGLWQLRDHIESLPGNDLWERKARISLEDELDRGLAGTVAKLLNSTDPELSVAERLSQWQQSNQNLLKHFQSTCDEVNSQDAPNLSMLSVAVRELSLLY